MLSECYSFSKVLEEEDNAYSSVDRPFTHFDNLYSGRDYRTKSKLKKMRGKKVRRMVHGSKSVASDIDLHPEIKVETDKRQEKITTPAAQITNTRKLKLAQTMHKNNKVNEINNYHKDSQETYKIDDYVDMNKAPDFNVDPGPSDITGYFLTADSMVDTPYTETLLSNLRSEIEKYINKLKHAFSCKSRQINKNKYEFQRQDLKKLHGYDSQKTTNLMETNIAKKSLTADAIDVAMSLKDKTKLELDDLYNKIKRKFKTRTRWSNILPTLQWNSDDTKIAIKSDIAQNELVHTKRDDHRHLADEPINYNLDFVEQEKPEHYAIFTIYHEVLSRCPDGGISRSQEKSGDMILKRVKKNLKHFSEARLKTSNIIDLLHIVRLMSKDHIAKRHAIKTNNDDDDAENDHIFNSSPIKKYHTIQTITLKPLQSSSGAKLDLSDKKTANETYENLVDSKGKKVSLQDVLNFLERTKTISVRSNGIRSFSTKSNAHSSNELNPDNQNNFIQDQYEEENLNNASMEMDISRYETKKYTQSEHGDDNSDIEDRCYLAMEIINIINDCTQPLCDDSYCKKSVRNIRESNKIGYLEKVNDAMGEILDSNECKDLQEEGNKTRLEAINNLNKIKTIEAKDDTIKTEHRRHLLRSQTKPSKVKRSMESPEKAYLKPFIRNLDSHEVVVVKGGQRVCGSGCVLGNSPLVQNKGYFEVKLQQGGVWAVGLATRQTDLNRVHGGVDKESWCLNSDGTVRHANEELYHLSPAPKDSPTADLISTSPTHNNHDQNDNRENDKSSAAVLPSEGDTIGVAYDHVDLNFYLNGKNMEIPVRNIRGTVYPALYVDDGAILDIILENFLYPPPSGFEKIMVEQSLL